MMVYPLRPEPPIEPDPHACGCILASALLLWAAAGALVWALWAVCR